MLEAGGRRRLLLWEYNCVCVRVSTMVNSESVTKKVVQWRPVLYFSSVLFALDWRWAAGQQKITKIPRLEPIMNPAGRKPSLIYHILRRNLVFTKKMETVLLKLYILNGLPDENVLGSPPEPTEKVSWVVKPIIFVLWRDIIFFNVGVATHWEFRMKRTERKKFMLEWKRKYIFCEHLSIPFILNVYAAIKMHLFIYLLIYRQPTLHSIQQQNWKVEETITFTSTSTIPLPCV